MSAPINGGPPGAADASGQRLDGLSHAELYRMAHGGNPESAGQAGARLSGAADTLRGVSAALDRTASSLGVAWTGQAADATRGGIGAHAHWAQQASERAALAGASAAEQAASARNVITQMPPPVPAPDPLGKGANPVAVNAAQVEQAQENARLRALELMRGHAEVSARGQPQGPFLQPSAAGAGPGGQVGRTGPGGAARRAPGRVAGPAGGGGGPAGGGRAPVGRAASPSSGGVARGVPGAAGTQGKGLSGTRSAPTLPAAASRSGDRPASAAVASASGPGAGGWRPGLRAQPGYDRTDAAADHRWPRAERLPENGGPARGGPALPGPAHPGPGHPGPAPRGNEAPVGPNTGPDRAAGGDARPSGGTGDRELTAGVPPPMGAGVGFADIRANHRRLDFLIDDDSIFTDGDGSVCPPVIGT